MVVMMMMINLQSLINFLDKNVVLTKVDL